MLVDGYAYISTPFYKHEQLWRHFVNCFHIIEHCRVRMFSFSKTNHKTTKNSSNRQFITNYLYYFCLKSTVSNYLSRDTSAYGFLLDLVNYSLLWDNLELCKVLKRTVPRSVEILVWKPSYMRWGVSANGYRLECNVCQRGLTSPDLWNLYVEGLIEELRNQQQQPILKH